MSARGNGQEIDPQIMQMIMQKKGLAIASP